MADKFTPAPWLFRAKNDAVYTAPPEGSSYQFGEYIFGFKEEDDYPKQADFLLILAAPQVLTALINERRLRMLGQEPDVHWESMREERRIAYAATDAAIAKALGELS